jgi:uncharacterized membrane protein YfhO
MWMPWIREGAREKYAVSISLALFLSGETSSSSSPFLFVSCFVKEGKGWKARGDDEAKLTARAKGTMTGVRTRVVNFILKQYPRDFILRVPCRVVGIVRPEIYVRVERADLDS